MFLFEALAENNGEGKGIGLIHFNQEEVTKTVMISANTGVNVAYEVPDKERAKKDNGRKYKASSSTHSLGRLAEKTANFMKGGKEEKITRVMNMRPEWFKVSTRNAESCKKKST